MTQHQGLPVKGYAPQSDERVEMVNMNKMNEEQILRTLDMMAENAQQFDPRWTAIARTHFEIAFMAMNRAIFRPRRIALPEDEAKA
jgi:hypothetical protein